MGMLNRREFLAAPAALTIALRQKANAAAGKGDGEWRNKQSGTAYRRLGRTGFMVSEFAMGGNSIRPTNFEHVLAAHERGLNYFDAAPDYGRGACETLIGNAIKHRRHQVFVSTKFSPEHSRYQDVINAAEGSLKRLCRSPTCLFKCWASMASLTINLMTSALKGFLM